MRLACFCLVATFFSHEACLILRTLRGVRKSHRLLWRCAHSSRLHRDRELLLGDDRVGSSRLPVQVGPRDLHEQPLAVAAGGAGGGQRLDEAYRVHTHQPTCASDMPGEKTLEP
eukprot:9191050-Pyramimonas_sp.AAC.1